MAGIVFESESDRVRPTPPLMASDGLMDEAVVGAERSHVVDQLIGGSRRGFLFLPSLLEAGSARSVAGCTVVLGCGCGATVEERRVSVLIWGCQPWSSSSSAGPAGSWEDTVCSGSIQDMPLRLLC